MTIFDHGHVAADFFGAANYGDSQFVVTHSNRWWPYHRLINNAPAAIELADGTLDSTSATLKWSGVPV
jgi:hypothetical protein